MSGPACPFCAPDAERIFHAGRLVLGLWDRFPVSPGHALLIPKRHVASWFDATLAERAELVEAVEAARAAIQSLHAPDGFNLGVNVGEAGGQTVPHLHLHVIPRYRGDVADPRGGVRHVLPERANYLAGVRTAQAETGSITGPGGAFLLRDARDGARGRSGPGLSAPPHAAALVTGEDDPLLPHLLAHLDHATAADIAVAFVLESGVALLEEHLRDLLDREGRLRFLTGDYQDVTEPNALLRLLDLASSHRDRVSLRTFETRGTSFHPKAFVFRMPEDDGVAYVGSSNLTRTALAQGLEWNYRVIPARDRAGFADVLRQFDRLFRHPATRPLDAAWVDAYRERRRVRPAPRRECRGT
jgi:diadenosine tetraphosphate (Ap4A) HIT family hydrolase/HKD family nuclease